MGFPILLSLGLLLAPADPSPDPSSEPPGTAPGDPVQLRWTGPSSCPGVAEVRGRVQTDSGALPVVADAVVTQDELGWSLDLRIEGDAGLDARTLHGESCEALADAAALLIGVAAAPTSAKPETDAEPKPAPEPEPEPEPEPLPPGREPDTPDPSPDPSPRADADPDPVRRPSAIGLHTRVSGVLQLGPLLPGVATGGVAGVVGLSVPWIRVEARGSYLGPREVRDPDASAIGARVDGWSVGASGCGVWDSKSARLFVPLCLGAQLGRARARGFGLEQSGVGRGLWAHVVLDAGLGVRVAPRWALVGAAQAVVSLRRPAFRVRDSPTLFQTGAAAARIVIGVEFRFLAFSRDRKPRTRRLAEESP